MPDLSLEQTFAAPVCGIDEVGRGPLAGPVMAACVYIPSAVQNLQFWSGVTDSKKIPAARREKLATMIQEHTCWGLGVASVEEIDTVNILQATFLAMRRAYETMTARADCPAIAHALIDGNRPPPMPVPVSTIIRGDSLSLSIAAASIIAKVARDDLMVRLDAEHPGYGWAQNAGYGTAAHLAALEALGPSPHHRVSFAPISRISSVR